MYQENHQKLEIANETIVKGSRDAGACYGVKKCAEIVFRKGKDWEHWMRATNTVRGPDLMLEDESKEMICIVDMACPCESNIHEKRIEKLRKY